MAGLAYLNATARLWWNWQTRNLEGVVPSGVQVQVLLTAPFYLQFHPKHADNGLLMILLFQRSF